MVLIKALIVAPTSHLRRSKQWGFTTNAVLKEYGFTTFKECGLTTMVVRGSGFGSGIGRVCVRSMGNRRCNVKIE